MKTVIAILLFSLSVKSQCKKFYTTTNCYPEFPNGERAMNKWLDTNRTYYPSFGKESALFIVHIDSTGKIDHARIMRTWNQTKDTTVMEMDCLRLFKSMPDWRPAKIGNNCTKAVCFEKQVRIYFTSKNFDKE
jgi:hypothetical protein